MTEATMADDHTSGNGRLCKPPNRKKYEKDVAQCNSAIQSKESQLKSLSRESEKLQTELDRLKSEKTANTERRQEVNNELTKINQDICKQEADLVRLQSGLQYKSETKITEAVNRLQHQLRTQNFRLNEEKKIVAEIDTLKRSRKDLGAFLLAKKQLDEKRAQARSLRDQRDRLYRTGKTMIQKDEQLRRDFATAREESDSLKHEIGDERRRLKCLSAEFSEHEKMYEEQRRRHIALQQRVKKEERKAAAEAHQLELAELKAFCDPYLEEKTLCATLSNYLRQRYGMVATSGSSEETDRQPALSASVSPDSPSTSAARQDVDPAGMYRLCKKLDDDEVQSRSKPLKKSRKDRRKVSMTHTPQIFAQFARLDLSAPMALSDVDNSLRQLRAKQEYYDSLLHADAEMSQEPLTLPKLAAVTACDTNATPSSAASFTCSAPTTPDVQVDTIRLMTPDVSAPGDSTGHRRKLSHDSGACELEEVARCLADSSVSPTCERRHSVTSSAGSDTTVTLADGVDSVGASPMPFVALSR